LLSVHHSNSVFDLFNIEIINYCNSFFGGKLEKMILVLLRLVTSVQHVAVGNVFEVLPDASSDKIYSRIIPEDGAEELRNEDVYPVLLAGMCLFVGYDFSGLVGVALCFIQKNVIEKGKGAAILGCHPYYARFTVEAVSESQAKY
jgi:hypothetical protein